MRALCHLFRAPPQRARLMSGAEGGLLPPDLEIDPESLRFEAKPIGTGAFGEVR